ncbi:MAG: hypothetical protein ACI8P3_002123 [Saprospiraceae bacterium]|jgi:hypothetical protein
MNTSKIKPESVEVLRALLKLNGALIVYDPLYKMADCSFFIARDIRTLLKNSSSREVCINLSGRSLEVLSFDFILEIDTTKRKYKSFFCEQFLTIKNPDRSVRWFLPVHAKHPDFLALYNGAGIKASLFNFVVRMAFIVGLKKWVCREKFFLYSKEEKYFQKQFDNKELAVFTGTVGENRKAVVAICENGKATHFVKIPVSETAKQLIETEHAHLVAINEYGFKRMSVPVSEMKAIGLQLTSIRPKDSRVSITLNDLHLEVLKNLYANTFQLKMLSNLDSYQEIENHLKKIKLFIENKNENILDRKTERLAYNIKGLLKTFDKKQLIPVAYAHGDFTPWNMFVTEKRIHLYDWELAMPEQLFLYDAFHFVFQSSILILHQPFEQIKAKIIALENREVVIDLLERYKLDYWACYRWYLISNCSYYLDLYLSQETLHVQAHWLVDCWIEATNDAIITLQRKVEMV